MPSRSTRGLPRPMLFAVVAFVAWIVGSYVAAAPIAAALGTSSSAVRIAFDIALAVAVIGIVARTKRTPVPVPARIDEQTYRSMLDHLPLAIYVLQVDPVAYIYANPAFERLMGAKLNDFQYDRAQLLRDIHPDDVARMELTERLAHTEPHRFSVRTRIVTGDGSQWRTLELQERVLRSPTGRPIALQGTVVDVTERQQHAEELEDLLAREQHVTAQLREVREMQATFLQAVSHELRTPLAVISGIAKTLEQHHGALAGDMEADLRGRLVANAERLERLLGDLLDVDRLTRGVIEPRREWTDLSALVRRTVELLDVGDDNIETPHVAVDAYIDAPQVERIVENLVANAHRHTPPGTTIRIHTARNNGGAELIVEDDGPGLPDGLDLFDPFVQGDPSMPQPGTGIGLTLVSQFAQLHGGFAYAETAGSGGASIRVELPDSLADEPAPELPSSVAEAP